MNEEIKRTLEQFPTKKVMVLGDFYLDEYIHCKAEHFSPEAPVPRAVVNNVEHVPGCAGNIAVALKSLGAQVMAAGSIGFDEKGNILKNKLLEKGVITSGLFSDQERVTGVFSRILLESSGDYKQHHIRFDFENKKAITPTIQEKIKLYLEENLPNLDLLFIADYDENAGTGLITENFLNQIIPLVKKQGLPIAGISRLNIKQFADVDILICNRKELSAGASLPINNEETLTLAIEKLREQTKANTILITLGKEGLIISRRGSPLQKYPSYVKRVVDVCGAGDALSSAYALCAITNCPEQEQGLIASHAAAVAISKPGTAPAYAHEIIESIAASEVYKNKRIDSLNSFSSTLTNLKKQKKRIVLTNGYFDLIHASHINFLKEAKKQGDLLIVAINSDKSTRENKGAGRPILPEEERVNILSSLECVDYVTIFEELTPVKVISLIKPDILVKGGNFTPDEVVGRDIVESYGGEIRIIQLPGLGLSSTQQLIDKIKTEPHLS